MQKYFFIIFIVALYACKEAPTVKLDPMTAPLIPSSNISDNDNPVVEKTWTDRFFELVNQHRGSMGLKVIVPSTELSSIAQIHSAEMAEGTVAFGHSGFSERCGDARAALGGGNWCAENVANGQATPEAVFKSWMSSAGHRANIESPRATHSGLGFARSLSGKYYWTQLVLEL